MNGLTENEIVTEADYLYLAHRGLIIDTIKKRFGSHVMWAYHQGLLPGTNYEEIVYSSDVYLSVRNSIRAWLRKGQPTKISAYIYQGLRNWAWRMCRRRHQLNAEACTHSIPAKDHFDVDIEELKSQLPERLLPILEATLNSMHADLTAQAESLGLGLRTYKGLRTELKRAILEVANV